MKNLEQVYQHIVQHRGISYHLEHGLAPTYGYMVATVRGAERVYSALTREKLADFIKANAENLIAENNYLGVWYNEANGFWYFDIASHFEDREKAMKKAFETRQIAFWDLENECEIMVK